MRTTIRLVTALAATVLLALVVANVSVAAQQEPDHEPPQVVRIYYDTLADLPTLSAIDLLEVNNLQERYVMAIVTPAQLAALRSAGLRVQLDLAHTTRLARADLFAEGYRTVPELFSDLEQFAAAYPDLAELVPFGRSHCLAAGGCVLPGGESIAGHELLALRITNENVTGTSSLWPSVSSGSKPVFFLIANIHAREITTPELAMRWIEYLLQGYGQDADITWLVNEHELWVVPVVNPDGHRIVELGPQYGRGPLLHRKNANQDADNDGQLDCSVWPSESYGQFGVDLNRNHSFSWQPSSQLSGLCSLIYAGPGPASEPEVTALENLVRALIPDQRGPGEFDAAPWDTAGLFISLHSYSELVLRPWAHINEPAPNEAGLRAIGDRLAALNGYLSCRPGDCLYTAAGTSDNWAYGELGIPAFTFEVGSQFLPPYSEIDTEQWPLNRPALLYAARIARTPYLTVFGPEVTGVEVSTTGDGSEVTLQAVADDRTNTNDSIVGAEYSIGVPFWSESAEPQAMTPVDGAYDSSREIIAATFSTASLPRGRHLVYLRAKDAAGYYGPPGAAFVEGTAASQQFLPILPSS